MEACASGFAVVSVASAAGDAGCEEFEVLSASGAGVDELVELRGGVEELFCPGVLSAVLDGGLGDASDGCVSGDEASGGEGVGVGGEPNGFPGELGVDVELGGEVGCAAWAASEGRVEESGGGLLERGDVLLGVLGERGGWRPRAAVVAWLRLLFLLAHRRLG